MKKHYIYLGEESIMPKLSVIIPVYNAELYLSQCLYSVVNQSLKDIEIILINDGSTDNSTKICNEIAAQDSRIKLFNQENAGAAAARNLGIENATGDYILFLDCDDIFSSELCKKLYNEAIKNDNDITICHSIEFDNKTKNKLPSDWIIKDDLLPSKKTFNYKDIPNHVIGFCQGWAWDKLYKTDFIKKQNLKFPNLNNTEDMYFVMLSLILAEKISVIKDVLVYHRQNIHTSLSNTRDKNPYCFINAIYLLKQTLEEKNIYDKIKQSFVNWILEFCFWNLDTITSPIVQKKLAQKLESEVFKKLELYSLKKDYFYNRNIYKRLHSKCIYKTTKWYQKIFSIKNTQNYKRITILGLKLNVKKNEILTISNQEQKIDIIFLLDDHYFLCTYAALKSIKSNKDITTLCNIFILSQSLSKKYIDKLLALNDYNFSIEIINVEQYCTKYKEISNIAHISNTALIKFDIPNILNDLDKVLYLDGDILVTKDLSNLFNTDINEFFLGAIREIRAEKQQYNKLVGTKYYFNSGVMLLNLKKMREDNITDKLINCKLNQPPTWQCMDQDVFNYVVNNNFKELSPEYNNTITIFLESDINNKEINNFYKTNYHNLKEFCKASTILHFAGKLKPWIFDLGYLSKLYKRYSNTSNKLKKCKYCNTFWENIFSIRNLQDNKHKIINICGIKFKIKRNKLKKMQRINKHKILKEIANNKIWGLNTTNRTQQVIVSLTSFPQRMYDIHFCLYSLLNQTLKPDRLILWLAEEEFPNKEKDIPNTVLSFKEKGLEIKWCNNIKSYKKLIPALKEFPNAIIVTADDDIYYPVDWLEKLYNSYQKEPQYIHCHRAHKILFDSNKKILPYKMWEHETYNQQPDYINFFTGAGGVLYPQGCLNTDVLNEELFTSLAPNADDIWFWAMAVLQGTKIKVVDDNIKQLTYINPERELGLNNEITLCSQNCGNGQNDIQLANVLKQYPQIMERIINE